MNAVDEASSAAPAAPPPLERTFDEEWIERAVSESDLRQMGVRPPLREYLNGLWLKRSFIRVLAVSRAREENQNTYLGQVWALLTPIFNAAVYVIVFGFILEVGREGVDNTVGFIVVGVFMFRFFERSVSAGARSITNNLTLVRSVQFPRAVLPIAGVLTELAMLGPALIVMCLISYFSGFLPFAGKVTIDWYWPLLIPAVALTWIFSTGCAFLVARWVASTPDLENLLPHFLRVLMYCSGVIFSIDRYLGQFSWGWIMEYQPVAVYLHLARSCILDEPAYPQSGLMWVLGVGWAVLFFVVGFFVFWQGEERYGRV